MELKEALAIIDPNQYNKLISQIEIQDTYLKRLQCSAHSRNIAGEASYSFKEEIGTVAVIESKASLEIKYELVASYQDKDVFQLSADYVLNYEVQEELSDAFYTIFKHYTAPLQSFPYFRELAHSMTTRMGLSPMILPLRKVLFAKPKTQKELA
jgi:preprotein translocase subunit SecB